MRTSDVSNKGIARETLTRESQGDSVSHLSYCASPIRQAITGNQLRSAIRSLKRSAEHKQLLQKSRGMAQAATTYMQA